MKKFSCLLRAPALSCVSLLFTLHFSLFTFNSCAQGVTKYGEITSNSSVVVPTGTTTGDMLYWNGSAWVKVTAGTNGQTLTFYNGAPVWTYSTSSSTSSSTPSVVSSTGRIWMDRNLGATQVATSSTDADSYGDLYQWGRRSDGHQLRTSTTTTTLSTSDAPAHGSFITISTLPRDWRSGQNANLWQGVNGVNNPCPSGYRLPTKTELGAEITSWGSSSPNAADALASVLKLPMAGDRFNNSGSLGDVGTAGFYWGSTVDATQAHYLFLNSSGADVYSYYRAIGFSVRCIKD